jgi:DNA-binding NarL/FixJ family response regulator
MKRTADSRATKTTSVNGAPSHDAPVGATLLSDIAWSAIARSLKLSARELEIVRGVFDNLKEDAIAGKLGSSEHTIHTHLHRLFGKLRVTTRTQMVVRIMQELLILTLSDGGSLPSICRHRANGRCPMED